LSLCFPDWTAPTTGLLTKAISFIASKFKFTEYVAVNSLLEVDIHRLVSDMVTLIHAQPEEPPELKASLTSKSLLTIPLLTPRSPLSNLSQNSVSQTDLTAVTNSPSLAVDSTKEGKYKIVKALSKGGQGSIYLVHAIGQPEHELYVMKRIILKSVEEMNRAFQEVKSLYTLRTTACDNISNILDFFVENPKDDKTYVLCLILEYYQGGDLRNRLQSIIRRKKSSSELLPESLVLDWFKQMCAGLRCIHQHGFVHRDLKPENIFFETKDYQTLKIGDFGLSV
jgi:hypothetical protein